MKRDAANTTAKKFLALLVGVLAAIAILEAGLRIFSPFETRLRGDKIVLPINKQYVYDGSHLRGVDGRITHSKNALGFRGPDYPQEADDRLKIIAVGGSTTECMYLSDGKDWPNLLRQQLEKDIGPVWLNNAGLDGHTTIGHKVLLDDIVLDLQPDIIIFLIGANDVTELDGYGEQTASQIKGEIKISSPELLVKSLAAYSEIASLSLNLYRYMRARTRGLDHQPVNSIPPADIQDADLTELHRPHIEFYLPAYKERLSTLVDLVQGQYIDAILVTQPALYGDGTVAWSILQLYNDVTRSVGKEKGLVVVNLDRKLEKSLEYFYDDMHFTNAGSAEVANILYKDLNGYFSEQQMQPMPTQNIDQATGQ